MSDLLQKTIDNLAKHLAPAVEAIEANDRPTTRNNYSLYMAIFSQFADDAGQGRILAMALKKAGGNAQGVDDALKAAFG